MEEQRLYAIRFRAMALPGHTVVKCLPLPKQAQALCHTRVLSELMASGI